MTTATRTRRPRRELAPVDITERYRSSRTGRLENWAARTRDGEWAFQREEDTRTDWLVYHQPSVADESWTVPVMICGTLRACQSAVAEGWAAAQLAQRKAGEA
jgi:hypothetical protein